jgi:hypothetical protein
MTINRSLGNHNWTPALGDEHLRVLVQGSGIHPDVARARGYATVRTVDELVYAIGYPDPAARVVTTQPGENYPNDPNDVTVHMHYGLDGEPRKGHFAPAQMRLPGLLIPTWWNGRVVGHQLRPDHPRMFVDNDDASKVKVVKYEQPTGLPTHLDAHPHAWPYVQDPAYVLVVTEGGKKADALQTQLVPTIALTGVWNWQRDHKPFAEWNDVPLDGRWVYVAFDSDVATNQHVQQARFALTEFLRSRGARVRWIQLPSRDGTKFGIDDYLAAGHQWLQLVDAYDVDPNPLGFRSLADVRKTYTPPSWLIERFLIHDAFAVVGGAEKTLKSYIMIATVIAVASGRPLFCDERFTVTRRRRVVVLTGEGSVNQFYERIEHMCKMGDVDYALEVEPYVTVTDRVRVTTSREFRAGLVWAIQDHDPGLVVLDPAYVYLDADEQPGNVFKMGRLLGDLRQLCIGRAVQVGYHFTKAGAENLSLSSLTQAGAREAFDHWLLVAHAQDPDLDAQRFRLRARIGARRGFGWDATFDVDLGPFDHRTLQHQSTFDPLTGRRLTPAWRVLAPTAKNDGGINWRRQVYQDVRDAPGELTQNDIVRVGEGSNARRTALEWLREHGVVRTEKRPGPNGERRADRYLPTFDYDVDEAALLLKLPELAATNTAFSNEVSNEAVES